MTNWEGFRKKEIPADIIPACIITKWDNWTNCYIRNKKAFSTDSAILMMLWEIKRWSEKRGEDCGGRLLHGYTYNAANRLESSWDDAGREADYFYNALGQRTGKNSGGKTEEYLLDLTRAYHNLLGIEKTDGTQTFFWDFNVAVMEDERKKLHYYLQDDLGSPLRVLYGTGSGEVYGYDEFGRDLYEMEEEDSSKRRYSRQGEKQPFGYTGYRYDPVSGTYFAQAREYRPEFGRFMAEDIIGGSIALPKSLNRYTYCYNSPDNYVDFDGNSAIATVIIGAIAAAAIPAAVDFGFQVAFNISEGKEWNEDINIKEIEIAAIAGEILYIGVMAAPGLAGFIGISETAVILIENGIVGMGGSLASDLWANDEKIEREVVIENMLRSGVMASAFSYLGMKAGDWLDSMMRGFKIGLKWDKTYASPNFNGSTLYSREYHQAMVILKTLAVNGAYGGMELSIEVTANLIDKLIEEILNWDWGNKE